MPRTFTRSDLRPAERPPQPSYEMYMRSRANERRLQRKAPLNAGDGNSGRAGRLGRLWTRCVDRLALAGGRPGPQGQAPAVHCWPTP